MTDREKLALENLEDMASLMLVDLNDTEPAPGGEEFERGWDEALRFYKPKLDKAIAALTDEPQKRSVSEAFAAIREEFGDEFDAYLASQTADESQKVYDEWEIAGLTPQEMWDEIQAVRKATGDDGTHGAPHVLVEELARRLTEPRQVVSRETIEKAFGQFQEAQSKAIYALQLATPQPSMEIEEAVKECQNIPVWSHGEVVDSEAPTWICYSDFQKILAHLQGARDAQ